MNSEPVFSHVLLELSALLTKNASLQEMLEGILDLLKRVVPYESASIQLFDGDGNLNLKVGRGFKNMERARQNMSQLNSQLVKMHWSENQAIIIPDTSGDPLWKDQAGGEAVGSWIGAPLWSRGQLTGCLSVNHATPFSFTQAMGESVQLFANQASIAVDNSRLFEAERLTSERSEAMQDAARILSSTLSVDQVLEAVLEQLERVIPYDSGCILLLEGDHLYVRAWRNYDKFADTSQINKVEFDRNTPALRPVIEEGRPYIILDVLKDANWRSSEVGQHIRSWLGLPLKVRERVIGLFSLDRVVTSGFSQSEVTLVQGFAAHAAIAIENARLFESAGKRAAELEAIRQASLSLTASLELREVLDAIQKNILTLLPEANNSHIFLYNPENGGKLTFGAALWAQKTQSTAFSNPRKDGLTYTVARSGEIIVVPDMGNHPLYNNTPPDWVGAIIGMPLKIGQRVLGVMNVAYRQPRTFPEAELRVLRLFCDQAAIAIENARLFEQAETERRHLGLLHDMGKALASSLESDQILKSAIALTCKALGGQIGLAFLNVASENRLELHATYAAPQSKGIEPQYSPAGEYLSEEVLGQKEAHYIADLKQHKGLRDANLPKELPGSALVAPILAEKHLLGGMILIHSQARAFHTDQLNLLQTICQEIGLALSNASRYQQVQRRLAEMTLIQTLAETFSQRLELQVLLDEVVNQLGTRLGYQQARIFLLENDQLELRACHGPTPQRKTFSLHEGIIGRVARTGETAFVPNVSLDPDYYACIPQTASEIAVPIHHQGSVIGVINIESDQPNQLTDEDNGLLQLLADQISIALENAVLYERVRQHADELEHTIAQRTAELTELYNLSQEISYQIAYDPLLRLLLERLQTGVQSQMTAGILLSPQTHLFYIVATQPVANKLIQQLRLKAIQALKIKRSDRAEVEQIPYVIIRANRYDETLPALSSLEHEIQAPVHFDHHMSCWLMAANGQAEPFTVEQQRLLMTFANQAKSALLRLHAVLSAQQKHLESLVEHVPVGILLFDEDHNLLVTNTLGRDLLAVFENSPEQFKPLRFGDLTLEELIQHDQDLIPLEISLEGPPRRVFGIQIRQVGELKPQWVLTIREITQERDYQARIQGQDRLATVGQLAAGIAHDFNNIMAAILVYTDLLQHDPDIQQISRERLRVIEQQVQRAASLIRQILDFSRRSIMEQSNLDLLPFVKELDKLLGRVLPETIRLELTYTPGYYWVNADPTRLQQVFMNLAVNARDAMPDGGILHFGLEHWELKPGDTPTLPNMPPGDWARITVTDNGIGIPHEIQERIFEPFFTTKPVGQGTGLGLAQVYGIIKNHDGYIDVSSQPGMGTTFTIYLPALKVSPEAPPPPEVYSRVRGSGEPVLLVEDNEATLQALTTMLEAQNYRVITARNGQEALQCFKQSQETIAFIVSDIVMPEMSGTSLYEELRKQQPAAKEQPGFKILFITGHPLDAKNHALLEKENVHWLQKPFSVREFNQALKSLLELETRL
jgi:GAF domain-containing protein/C4-dicarboxylate-specific signal transduction histidine kinase/ActR/RegA family two-component response regulator